MDRIGMQLLQDSRNAIESGEKVAERRDLLSLLVRSNMSEDIPENQRLSDDVVVSRAQFPFNHPYFRAKDIMVSELPTFFAAGTLPT
jgi:hypothetical protein